MSGSSERSALDWAIPALAAVAVAVFLLLPGSDAPLRRSAIGFEGLAAWLRAEGVDATGFSGGFGLRAEDFGLRVLPLHDVDLERRADPPPRGDDPAERRKRLMAETLRDVDGGVVETKARTAPTLLVLPKWRRGAWETGAGHREFLIPAYRLEALRAGVAAEAGAISRREGDQGRIAGPGGLTTYLGHPQTVAAGDCLPLLGDEAAMLLGFCAGRGDRPDYWLLADPDLLNNHGLGRGDNAAIATALLAPLAEERRVLVDMSTAPWLGLGTGADDGRDWSDLAKFFEPPFAVLWLAAFGLAGLAFWRAVRRDGPVVPPPPEADGPGAARALSIAVKARLLRLAGRDASLARTMAEARIDALAAEVLGPRAPGDRRAALARALDRRRPALAADLRAIAAGDGPGEGAPPETVMRFVEHVDGLLEGIRDEFGRSEGRRRPHRR